MNKKKKQVSNLQSLYNEEYCMKRMELQEIETKYEKRLQSLDSMVNEVTRETTNKLLIEWENNQFDMAIDGIFKETDEEIIDYNIKNQFNNCYYRLSKQYGGFNSCVPISLMFCYYYMFETIDYDMTKAAMKQGIVLYNEWKILNNNNIHPTLTEILNLDLCKPFYNKIKTIYERGGLFNIIDKNFEQQELTNQRPTLKQLIIELMTKPKVCLILGIKKHYFISVIITNNNGIFLFDSHGTKNENIDYIKINNINSFINYVSKTYDIRTIRDREHQELLGKKMNEFDFYCKYGYTSFIFY